MQRNELYLFPLWCGGCGHSFTDIMASWSLPFGQLKTGIGTALHERMNGRHAHETNTWSGTSKENTTEMPPELISSKSIWYCSWFAFVVTTQWKTEKMLSTRCKPREDGRRKAKDAAPETEDLPSYMSCDDAVSLTYPSTYKSQVRLFWSQSRKHEGGSRCNIYIKLIKEWQTVRLSPSQSNGNWQEYDRYCLHWDPLQLSKLTGEAGRTIENYSFVSNMESGIFPQEK